MALIRCFDYYSYTIIVQSEVFTFFLAINILTFS